MELLVLGGSVFLSREVAAQALARGHSVTCACRGTSGPVPDGAVHVEVDRTGPLPEDLGRFDAVVDVARQPSWVRRGVAALPDAHWVFVSTMNVYADEATPGQTPATGGLVDPVTDDVDLATTPDAYGPMKVACEDLVRAGAVSATVIRPGLIVGPGDPTGRFTYWPARLDGLADGAPVLAPGDPADLFQVVDVRDLAAWVLDCAEQRTVGTFDGIGKPLPIRDLLAAVAEGCGARPSWTWVPQDELAAQDIQPWTGPRSVPLWLPRPEYDGLSAHDVRPSLAAGLRLRPLAETARDTLAWLRDAQSPVVTGLTSAEEAEVLAARAES